MVPRHCFQGRYSSRDILVVTGDTQRVLNESTGTRHKVCDVRIHKDYNTTTFDNDIALIKLCCNARFSRFVTKARLPHVGDEAYYRPGTECVISGWGYTKKAQLGDYVTPSLILTQASLPIAPTEVCKLSTHFTVADTTFCAGDGTGNENTCAGDSGAPLVCKRNSKDSYVVTGIVGWGIGCGQPATYSFFTNVLKLRQWIEKELASDDCYNRHCRYIV